MYSSMAKTQEMVKLMDPFYAEPGRLAARAALSARCRAHGVAQTLSEKCAWAANSCRDLGTALIGGVRL